MTGRFVWISDALAERVDDALAGHDPTLRNDWQDALVAAPADPAEAVRKVLRDSVNEWGEASWTYRWTAFVLRALGAP